MTLDLEHLRRVAEAAGSSGRYSGKLEAAHIAAFDPPTVLALIDRLEAAEAELAGAEKVRAIWRQQAEESHLLAMNRGAVLKELYGHPDGPDADPTASEDDGGPEGHRDDDNAGDGRCGAQEGTA